MDVRVMEESDADDLLPLLDLLGWKTDRDRLSRRIRRLVGHPDCNGWIAIDGKPVGLATGQLNWMIQLDEPVAELTALAVLPEADRSGIGSRLVATFEDWATAAGAKRLKITSGDHRPDAHAFYERLGYEHSGVRFHRTILD